MIPLKQAKDYYKHGIITSFEAVKDKDHTGNWLLSITSKGGEIWMLKTWRNEVRSFSSLNSLVTEVERITGGIVENLTIYPNKINQ